MHEHKSRFLQNACTLLNGVLVNKYDSNSSLLVVDRNTISYSEYCEWKYSLVFDVAAKKYEKLKLSQSKIRFGKNILSRSFFKVL